MTASTGERDDRERALNPPPEEPGDIPADTFALRLVASRHHAGHLSIREAAARCRDSDGEPLNRGTWQDWERGRRPQDMVDVCRAVADGLGMKFSWLLLGGTLLPAKGRPTKRPGGLNRASVRRYVRPADTRPIGGPVTASASAARPVRRPRIIDRTQPVAV